MMKLKYQRAILSFCEDLTDPNAISLPIGILLIGDLGESRLGAAVVCQPTVENQFVAEYLVDALAIVKEHIAEVTKDRPEAPIGDILHSLYTMLQNSLFVSSIGDQQEVEICAATKELYDTSIVEVAQRELNAEMRKALAELPASTLPTRDKPRHVRAQQTEVWELQ